VYLDPQQRYRLIEPQSLENIAPGVETRYGTSARVLDCQPFQKSLLEALIEQQQGNSGMSELPMSQSSTTPLDAGRVLGIPEIAQPYLALQESYRQTLPEIHDAWQQDGEAVVLLEDRSGWKMIGDLWGSEETPTLQILSWLGEMTQLWEALEPWHCRQSLLEITNLRVDEDGVLGLVRLYPEAREQPLTLQDLGHMWQMLSNQSQRTQFTSLGGLFRQMCTNEFGTINEVRSHLEAIAHEQQLSAPEAAPYDDLDEVLDAGTKSFALGEQPAPVSPNDSDDPTVILPMQLLSLDDSGCTDIGQQRDHNEDCFGILTEVKKQENPMGRAVQARGLYILCDGMGGHEHGEVASKMAVETLKRYFQDNWHDQFPTEDSVREAVRLANQAIYDLNQQKLRSGTGRMGTTLVMMLIQNTKAVIAHVGDSRLYCLTRKRGLEQLTMDHSVGQREIMRGVEPEIAHARLDAVQLTQALGPRSEQFINPDVKFLDLNEDTLFVLCSDGLSDNDLLDDHWQTHLAPLLSSRANLDQGIFQLIELANEHNGHDNITAVLIRVKVRPNFEQQQLL
jgi:serine/threonine protein phosphatase PrpC